MSNRITEEMIKNAAKVATADKAQELFVESKRQETISLASSSAEYKNVDAEGVHELVEGGRNLEDPCTQNDSTEIDNDEKARMKQCVSEEAVVFDILEEAVIVSPADKAVADTYLKQFGKYSVMDLRPQSKFALSLDAELQESVLRGVFESIDKLITDDLHEFLMTFFNADRGPQGWHDSLEEITIDQSDSDIVKNAKKLVKETLVKFLKAFSLASINPLRDVSILERPHLNQFVHPIIDSARV